MANNVLEELKVQAREAKEPSISPVPSIRLGGVDPLGLRQINFDLMAKRAKLVFYTAWEMANRDAMLKRDIPLTQQ